MRRPVAGARAKVIAVDSSALVAILFGERDADALTVRLAQAGGRHLSAVNYVETGTVIAGRLRGDRLEAVPLLDAFLRELGVSVRPVDEVQMRLALQARIAFGRGFGATAGLNFGDSFAYALAKGIDAPLLFVGDNFTRTDLRSAMA